jgi:hypothetical protein
MSDADAGFNEQGPTHEWGKLPFDILESVGRLLSSADLAAARLTCSAWRTGVSFGVTHLRPRTVPNAGALSAVAGAGPAQLDAFPNIQVLDLRRTSISPFQLPALQRLAGRLRALQLTYLERVGRPHEYFAQLEALYQGLEQLAARMEVQLEMHVNEAPFARSFILSDCDLARIVAAPPSLAITSLHVSHQMSYSISQVGLQALMGLSTLRSLNLVSYGGRSHHCLDNHSFGAFSALSNLQQLHIGIVKHVTGDAFAEGLGSTTGLTDLTLVDCFSLQNRGLGQLVEAAPRLTSLTLIKCPWLTNSAVKHLQHLRGLAALSLADNGNISYDRGLDRLASLPQLRQVDIKRFPHFGPDETEQLLQAEGIEQVNDRCKLVRRHQVAPQRALDTKLQGVALT